MNSFDLTPQRHFPPPGLRQLGVSTDDSAIFIEDTIDRTMARCISASPSAVSFLSPQQIPPTGYVDVAAYDPAYLRTPTGTGARAGAGADPCAVRLRFVSSPTPLDRVLDGLPDASQPRGGSPSARMPEPMVPMRELERVEKERNRYEKMYEHQKMLYEEMTNKQTETYRALQEKIIDVIALSSRNEESKRYIRQLKKEMSESRTRVIDIQNKALEEARAERDAKSRYEAMIEDQTRHYEHMAERNEDAVIGMESFLQDLTYMKLEEDKLHVSQLDSLLKAAYTKNTALLRDLLRQDCQINLLFNSKDCLERHVDQIRREKKELEKALADERRHMMYETERFVEQIENQQQSILNLRQMLIRTMDTTSMQGTPDYASHTLQPGPYVNTTTPKSYVPPFETQTAVPRTGYKAVDLFSNSVRIPNSVGQPSKAHTTEGYEKTIHNTLSTNSQRVEDLFCSPSVDLSVIRLERSDKKLTETTSALYLPDVISFKDDIGSAATVISSSGLNPYYIPNSSEALTTLKSAQETSETVKNKQRSQHMHSQTYDAFYLTNETQKCNQRIRSGTEGHEKENNSPSHILKYQTFLKKDNARAKPDARGGCPRLAPRSTMRILMQRHNRDGESDTVCGVKVNDISSK
ncbi:unnamed protein product [Phytomonas sp. Hart1]|nr:unnamed protein product [Phytomonas sp. Hart1]|eukprot:CCW67522.1 unnamed protein product [Phytomonas sp. isolate Hart1]